LLVVAEALQELAAMKAAEAEAVELLAQLLVMAILTPEAVTTRVMVEVVRNQLEVQEVQDTVRQTVQLYKEEMVMERLTT
jgi:hypothetical protein